MKITIAHSPDSDDAFMFYGLAKGGVATGDLEVAHVLADIETLNRHAQEGRHEVTAISFHAYPHVADKYALMPCGGSIGDGYGPLLVAREAFDPKWISETTVAVPGTLTSAYLALQLFAPGVKTLVVPFDRILEEVREGRADVGLVIHEGQLTYGGEGLVELLDLGAWWKDETGLPLPLGGNAVRRDLGPEMMARLTRLVRETVSHSLSHRPQALEYAMTFARGMDPKVADRFVGMWVNDMTVEMGERGREAVQVFLDPPRIPISVPASWPGVKGPEGAPVTLVEFSDYQCGYCRRAEPTVGQILVEYGDKIRFVYMDFPLSFHPRAMPSSIAAHCANEQGKYWPMHENLIREAGDLSDEDLKKRAAVVGLDAEAFGSCLASSRPQPGIEAAFKVGQDAGVGGTPSFFINGRMIIGAKPAEEFKAIIDDELARAAAKK